MEILHSFSELQLARNQFKGRLGLVPTMGALHEGHLSLIAQIRPKVDAVMATIFVNPTQFGPNEDFNKYPRQEKADLEKLEPLVNYVYLPKVVDIYSTGFNSHIHIGDVSEGLDGDFRPGHFDGVATVVNILFNQTRPQAAIFGEKDWQQLMVIKKLVADFSIPVEILSAPTLREADGLAMSSRNAYLTEQERKLAPLLYKYMKEYGLGAKEKLDAAGFSTQYVEQRWGRLLAAAYLGKTRLIDNIEIS